MNLWCVYLVIFLIKFKSINDKVNQKMKYDYKKLAVLVSEIVEHKTDPVEITQAVVDYMNKGVTKVEETKDESTN